MCDHLWEGGVCDVPVCPERCHMVGGCVGGVCNCRAGFTSADCGVLDMSPHFCSGRGVFVAQLGLCVQPHRPCGPQTLFPEQRLGHVTWGRWQEAPLYPSEHQQRPLQQTPCPVQF